MLILCALNLVIYLIGAVQESVVGQSIQKRFQLRFFNVSKLHAAVHHMMHQRVDVFGVFHALAVEVDDLVQSLETSVVHIRC